MNKSCNKIFTLKTYGADLQKWSPDCVVYNKKQPNGTGTNKRPYYCNAFAGSQGQDWVTTYTYNMVVVNYQQERQAYVACDYVE